MSEVGIVDKAAAILRLLIARPMTAMDICRRLGYSTSTGYRLLGALEEHGFVVRAPNGAYLLGPFPQGGSTVEVEGVLAALRDLTEESVQLWMRWDDTRVCVAAADSAHVLRVAASPGTALRLEEGGSAAFALQGEGSPGELHSTLGSRRRGVGSASIAFDSAREYRLAVCVSFPLARVPDDVDHALRAPMLRAVAHISNVLEHGGGVDVLALIAAEAQRRTGS